MHQTKCLVSARFFATMMMSSLNLQWRVRSGRRVSGTIAQTRKRRAAPDNSPAFFITTPELFCTRHNFSGWRFEATNWSVKRERSTSRSSRFLGPLQASQLRRSPGFLDHHSWKTLTVTKHTKWCSGHAFRAEML